MDFLIGIVGDGFVLTASDCTQARSIVVMKTGEFLCKVAEIPRLLCKDDNSKCVIIPLKLRLCPIKRLPDTQL